MKKNGLPPGAYEAIPADQYEPYVSSSERPREFTVAGVLLGAFFGALFGAANAYLGLRVGLTISTSIPIAVLSVLGFMAMPPFGRIGSILETNLSQTIGSASSSLASGMIFTIPALYLWNQRPTFFQLLIISVTGGLLGVLFMIPLRRFLIRGEHGKLPYPEGTACAEVMVAADRGGSDSFPIFKGIALGALFKYLVSALKAIKGDFEIKIFGVPNGQIGVEASPALLGVGYILGPRIGGVMVGGAALAWLVMIPALTIWGAERATPLYPETKMLLSEMNAWQIWTRYVRYIGAGAVALGGFISLFRSLPMIWSSAKVGFGELKHRAEGGEVKIAERVDLDLGLKWVVGFVVLIVCALTVLPGVLDFLPSLGARLISAVLIALFAFFFVTVSSRIVGMVGVTSNPTSGMTIATLLAVSGLFYLLGWVGPSAMAQALIIGSVVATAASIAGDASQDLKSGFLLGATPKYQQIGEIIGVLASVTFVCFALMALEKSFGFGSKELPAPQAMLMKVVVEGVLDVDKSIPWSLVLLGAGLAGVAALFRLPVLAFAVGIYLPLSTMTPVFIGGVIRWFVEKRAKEKSENVALRREKGVLFGSGLVAGEGLVGVGIAFYALWATKKPAGLANPEWAGSFGDWLPLIGFLILCAALYRITQGPIKR